MTKEKVEYTNKREAWCKLRYLQKNLNRKIHPRRIYYDRVKEKWMMTSKEAVPPLSFTHLLEICCKYSFEAGSKEDKAFAKKVLKYVNLITSKNVDRT